MYMFGADEEGDVSFSRSDSSLQQKNDERLMYVLSTSQKKDSFIRLNNDLYFGKMARSDELLGFTESYMKSILSAFVCIMNPAYFNVIFKDWGTKYTLTSFELTQLLDKCFGCGFASIVRKPWAQILQKYETEWMYQSWCSKFTPKVLVVDVQRLRDFLCTRKTTRNDALLFVTTNNTDGKTLWQNLEKILD